MEFSGIYSDFSGGARRYEREGHGKFRDLVTIGKNNRCRFERYCWGEAASLVCTMWGEVRGDSLCWDYAGCAYSGKEEAPVQLTALREAGVLELDGKRLGWQPESDLKRMPSAGGLLGGLFGKK